MAAAVIEGRVLSTQTRNGKRDDGTSWSMTSARVLVADTDVTEVTYDPTVHGHVRKDELVRVVADVSVYRGSPSFRAVSEFLTMDAPAAL